MKSEELVEGVRKLVDELDVMHEYLGRLPKAELELFKSLKQVLADYDRAKDEEIPF